MLFSKYRETAGSSYFSSISAASVQTGQNVLDDSQEAEEELNDNQSRPKKRRKIHTVTQKKWNWKDEYVEALIGYAPNSKILVISCRILHVNQMKSCSQKPQFCM